MGTDETVVTSFVGDDEQLLDTWRVEEIQRGIQRPPVMPATYVVAVTDERVLWFDEELQEIAREEITDVARDVIEHHTAPRVVRLASVATFVGLLGSAVVYFLSILSVPAALAPAAVGVGTLVAAFVFARVKGLSGTDNVFPRLQLETEDGSLAMWGDEDELDELAGAIGDDRSAE